jgi:pimeloyl-ACP methyl ester carboxylesterase
MRLGTTLRGAFSLITTVASLAAFLPTVEAAEVALPEFYQHVGKMKADGKLGQVIAKESVATEIPGAQAWRIAYISSDLQNRRTISTALIVAPKGEAPANSRPIMTWAHGTTGAAQSCGPSQIINPAVPLNEYFLIGGDSWTDYGLPSLAEFISDGYVVIGTDYQGQGGGGVHQYAVAVTQGRDAINAARAARSMKETGAGDKVIGYGWSQGGGAILSAASSPDYVAQKGTVADGLDFVGFVALAPYDMEVTIPKGQLDQAKAQGIMGEMVKSFSADSLSFAHFSMALYGMQAAFPGLKLTDLLTDQGAKVVEEVYSKKCVHAAADTINFNFGKEAAKLFRSDPQNTLAWIQAFVKGSVPPVKPIAPIVIYWGTKDTTQPPIQGELYHKQLCAIGVNNVQRVQLPGEQTHFTTPGIAGPFYRDWIKDRLGGKPVGDGCQS